MSSYEQSIFIYGCRPYIFQTMNSVRSNILNLKYQRFSTSGSKGLNIGVCAKDFIN